MLYRFLRFILTIAVRTYFRNITVRKTTEIPEGPLIVVANHPNTFLDPIVVGLQLKQQIAFLAKAEVFRSRFANWLLPKFNMIPVYRKQDDPSLMHKNEETFERCFEHLSGKGTLMIFPEGISLTQRKLEKIKTGAARIALGAEAANGFKAGVQILTVGLNYSNPHRFQGDLLINMDAPIDVSTYAKDYQEDPFRAAQLLTEEIRLRLEKNIIAIEEEGTDKLVRQIETIYKSSLLNETSGPSIRPGGEEDFIATKGILSAVLYYLKTDPERVERLRQMTDDYFTALDRLNLNDHLLRKFTTSRPAFLERIYIFLFLILGFPFWLFGVINNYLPYKLPYYIARSLTKKTDWHGALFVSLGIGTFLLFYSVQLYFVQRIFHQPLLTLGYFFLLPFTGFFAFRYYRRFTNLRGRWTILSLFIKRATLLSGLITMRQQITDELERGKMQYNKEINQS